jgi:coenzyme F420 hydrogenase subunit beta
VDESDVSLYRYRGYGNPGLTHVETADGRSFDFRYVDLWEEGPQRLQFRCKICPDAIGLQADLVVHDVWPDGPPEDDVPSLNGVIARTSRGMALLDAAVAAGAVEVTGGYDFTALANYQPHQVERRRAIAPRLAAMRDAGALCPRFEGLHLEELASDLSETERSAEHQSMCERLARGANRESP